eukprot:gnl/MRDRNA2_/MRDRNA2_27312_c0_seq1.p1 gnl/MRDRNA2_/MRDRNA2_27312_c0~~gnl/MRDRNA2_/MRDRNA2_27312_c0_seq1.p1  ORF type:complete len:802 (-),score=146.93 gnl/MRDRNA2_/MRDRNA2_27312_c0_seq1:43-2448(-)
MPMPDGELQNSNEQFAVISQGGINVEDATALAAPPCAEPEEAGAQQTTELEDTIALAAPLRADSREACDALQMIAATTVLAAPLCAEPEEAIDTQQTIAVVDSVCEAPLLESARMEEADELQSTMRLSCVDSDLQQIESVLEDDDAPPLLVTVDGSLDEPLLVPWDDQNSLDLTTIPEESLASDLHEENSANVPVEPVDEVPAPKLGRSTHSTLAMVSIMFFLTLAVFSLLMGRAIFAHFEKVDSALHRLELQQSLGYALRPGVRPGSLRAERLAPVRNAVRPMFNALPKNQEGRLSTSIVRHMAHRYFSHKYGWTIKGLQYQASQENMTKKNGQGDILRSKVPGYVEMVLEGKLSDSGFSLDDAAMLVAAVEQMIFDEVIMDVEASYHLMDIPTEKTIPKPDMLEVLYSFFVESIMHGDFTDKKLHMKHKRLIGSLYPRWDALMNFVKDTTRTAAIERNRNRRMSFAHYGQDMFSFEETAYLATRVLEEFGPWSDYECQSMKELFLPRDTHMTGRLQLGPFYRALDSGNWKFYETPEYLRHLGCLDESSKEVGPQVIIANYINANSNCLLAATHYSVCCMNECEGILRHFENRLQAPSASVSGIMQAASGMLETTSVMGKISNNTDHLRLHLEEIARIHGGWVPLHGRLFSQWLHFAFPHECPYPHTEAAINGSTYTGRTVVTAEEFKRYASAKVFKENQDENSTSFWMDLQDGMWTTQEQLLPGSMLSNADHPGHSWLAWLCDLDARQWLTTLILLVFAGWFSVLIVKSLLHTFKIRSHEVKDHTKKNEYVEADEWRAA